MIESKFNGPHVTYCKESVLGSRNHLILFQQLVQLLGHFQNKKTSQRHQSLTPKVSRELKVYIR